MPAHHFQGGSPVPSVHRSNFMKPTSNPFLAVLVGTFAALAHVAIAADVTKANNTAALNLTTSWTGGITPTSTAVALWNSTVAINGNQTWNVAASHSLSLFATSNSATEGLTGSGNLQITTAGAAGTMGVVNINTGDSGSTGFSGSGNSGYSGNWMIGNGGNATGTTAATSVNTGSIVNLRNGANAWGTGSITLNGGQIASTSGNWS